MNRFIVISSSRIHLFHFAYTMLSFIRILRMSFELRTPCYSADRRSSSPITTLRDYMHPIPVPPLGVIPEPCLPPTCLLACARGRATSIAKGSDATLNLTAESTEPKLLDTILLVPPSLSDHCSRYIYLVPMSANCINLPSARTFFYGCA